MTAKKKRQDLFLANFRTTGTIRSACEKCGLSRFAFYDWIRRDPAFKARWESVDDEVTDVIEQAAFKHAVEGNATLIIFLLKCRRPKKYREEFHHVHEVDTLEDWLREQDKGQRGNGRKPAAAAVALTVASAARASPRAEETVEGADERAPSPAGEGQGPGEGDAGEA